MKVLLFLLCIAYASCFYIDNDEKSKDKIVGGEFVNIEEVPYQATLHWFNAVVLCGAAIIDKSWILTAAHCTYKKSHLTVRTGARYSSEEGHRHKIAKIIEHPEYDDKTVDNDIALIKLETPIEFSEKDRPIGIAKSYDEPIEGLLMRVTGFGKISENGDTSSILKSAYVPIMNQEKCEKAYFLDPITKNMFCAGDGKTDACQGDSGGPAVVGKKIYGIVSTGMKCGSSFYPGVYTRVYKYYDWIVEQTFNLTLYGDGKADACQGDSVGPAVINNKLAGVVSSGIGCASGFYHKLYHIFNRTFLF